MKIFFIGSVKFSASVLKKLIELNADLIGVATLKNSKFNSDHFDLMTICIKNNISCKYTKNINSDENIAWIKNLSPDIIFCFGWSRLLKNELLNIPVKGVVGYHPTALPKHRGRHPLIWALVLGLKKTGSTFFFMDQGADSGDVLSQKDIKIYDSDNALTLYNRITKVALSQVEEFLPKLIRNKYDRKCQDASKASIWRKRGERDGQIDWRMAANNIYNLVRALTRPYVGAHFFYQEKKIIVWEVLILKNSEIDIEPGKVLSNDKDKQSL